MCDRLKPQLLGPGVAGNRFSGTEPIAQLVVTTSLNSNRIRIDLSTQIRIVAESCLERIYALSSGQLGNVAQQTITGQDTLATFPGEPMPGTERSYRFGGFGMRRWEVPNAKVEELIALDLMSAGLRQMLFNHWRDDLGFYDAFTPTADTDQGSTVSALLSDVKICREPSPPAEILAHQLREELLQQGEGFVRTRTQESDEPHAIERTLADFYATKFQGRGISAYVAAREAEQASRIRDAIRRIESRLTELWLDSGSTLALAQVPQALIELDSQLRAELDSPTPNSGEINRRQRVIQARRLEWDKLTWLTETATTKRRDLVRAHARDCAVMHELDLRDRTGLLDQAFVRGFLNQLTVIKSRFMATQEELAALLTKTQDERTLIQDELGSLQNPTSANKYEFDDAALKNFLNWTRRHSPHQHSTAFLLRSEVVAFCGQDQPLSCLAQVADNSEQRLDEALRRIALHQARLVHRDYETSRLGAPVLGDSLMTRLRQRFQNDPTGLQREVNEFLARAAACLHLQADTQPVQILGGGVGIPLMPKRLLLLGLPQHAYSATLEQSFRAAGGAGANHRFDTYTHADQTQVRLLLVDYWLAARFSSVLRNLGERYQQTTTGLQTSDTRYFCNIDPDGEAGRRPSLFLPDSIGMRLRYEAELWLGQQPGIGVVRNEPQGVFLLWEDQDGRHVEPLGCALEDALETADLGKMFKLHARLGESLGRAKMTAPDLKKVLDTRSRELEQSLGLTSPEYRHWDEKLRPRLSNLVQ